MTASITVKTGARLHFGFLSCKPAEGRQYGGVGLMIDQPGFELTIGRSDRFEFHGPHHWRDRIALACCAVGHNLFEPFPLSTPPAENELPYFRVEIRDEIPPHIGLGSGTQLDLAAVTAILRLIGEEAGPMACAIRVSRGARSAIGIHGFAHGGFLIDGGKLPGEKVGMLLARAEFPSNWRLLLVTPTGELGLAGRHEREAFDRLPPMPAETTACLTNLATESMLPAVVEADIDRFGDAIFAYGKLVGDYFASVQGGAFASHTMSELVDRLRKSGIRGVGQTSWGPTIFAVCSGPEQAEAITRDLVQNSRWPTCQFRTVAAKNTGADVSEEAR